MSSTNVNLYIDQGITYGSRVMVCYRNDTPVDLTGCTVAVTFRRSLTSSIAHTFTVVMDDAVNGTILLTLTSDETAALGAGRYVFDGEFTVPTGQVYSFIKGMVTVYPRVTR
jgi:hypothetical protein